MAKGCRKTRRPPRGSACPIPARGSNNFTRSDSGSVLARRSKAGWRCASKSRSARAEHESADWPLLWGWIDDFESEVRFWLFAAENAGESFTSAQTARKRKWRGAVVGALAQAAPSSFERGFAGDMKIRVLLVD